MRENKLIDLSMDLAIATIKICESITGHSFSLNALRLQ